MFVYHLNIILWSACLHYLCNIWFQSLVFTRFGDCLYKFWIWILCWIHLLQLVRGLLFSFLMVFFALGTDILNFGLCKTSLLFYTISNCLHLPTHTYTFSLAFLWLCDFLFSFVGEHFPLLKNFFWYFIHCGFPFFYTTVLWSTPFLL